MIETWTWQIPFALVGGTVVFLGVLVPAILVQYSAYGRLSLTRLLGTAALSVYGVALVAYTLLPLPDPSVCVGRNGGALQVIPGAVIADIARIVGENGIGSSFALATIAQPLLNIVLFIPLGLLVRAMTGRGIPTAILLGLAASLLIETTQYTGLWGIYDCGYRVADVDDLLTNTAGALVGAVAAPFVAGWVPRPAALAALPPQPVTRIRRLLGSALDAALISVMPAMLLPSPCSPWRSSGRSRQGRGSCPTRRSPPPRSCNRWRFSPACCSRWCCRRYGGAAPRPGSGWSRSGRCGTADGGAAVVVCCVPCR